MEFEDLLDTILILILEWYHEPLEMQLPSLGYEHRNEIYLQIRSRQQVRFFLMKRWGL